MATFYLRNRGDAEDEVQNAFSKAYIHLDQYQCDAEFSTWLGRIVTNQCLMLMRVRRRTPFVYLDENYGDAHAPVVELPACGPDPEGELAHRQMKSIVRMEISRIPPILRNVMLLRDIQELSMAEVAERLRITVPAAKSRLLRARIELRQRLMRHSERRGSVAALPRSAAPLARVSHHCPLRPLAAAS